MRSFWFFVCLFTVREASESASHSDLLKELGLFDKPKLPSGVRRSEGKANDSVAYKVGAANLCAPAANAFAVDGISGSLRIDAVIRTRKAEITEPSYLFSVGDEKTGNALSLSLTSSQVTFQYGENTINFSLSDKLRSLAWYHVVVDLTESKSVKLYLDCVESGKECVVVGDITWNGGDVCVGRHYTRSPCKFKGLIESLVVSWGNESRRPICRPTVVESAAAISAHPVPIPARLCVNLPLGSDGQVKRVPRLFRIVLGDPASPDVEGILHLGQDGTDLSVSYIYRTSNGRLEELMDIKGRFEIKKWKNQDKNRDYVVIAYGSIAFEVQHTVDFRVSKGTFFLDVKGEYGITKDGRIVRGLATAAVDVRDQLFVDTCKVGSRRPDEIDENLDKGSSNSVGKGQKGEPGVKGSVGRDGADGRPGLVGPRGLSGMKGSVGPSGRKGSSGTPGLPGRPASGSSTRGPPGSPGVPGPRGEQGPRGSSGGPGRPGRAGRQGGRGLKGEKGQRGVAGLKGNEGRDGVDGLKGDTGLPGQKGGTGESGLNGERGLRGEVGPVGPPGQVAEPIEGAKGSKGDQGATGLNGLDGAAGQKGEPGPLGAAGANGMKGSQGMDGQPGPKGMTGDGGDKGDKGDAGLTGPRGEQGLAGIAGDNGDVGPQGSKGSQGEKGVSGSTGLPGLKGEPGIGLAGTDGEKGEPGEGGHPGPPGRDGQAGPEGQSGLDGANGLPGERGSMGLPGPKGEPGPAPKEETLMKIMKNLNMSDSASQTRPVLSGEKGEKGETGKPGPVGSTGRKGEPGLRGQQGVPGVRGEYGVPGIDGSPGIKGVKGDAGMAGAAGIPGIDGVDGGNGEKGEPGVDGVKGEKGMAVTGPKGLPGMPGVAGLVGRKGEQGSDGLPGIVGPTGPNGSKGDKGDPGIQGPSGLNGVNGGDGGEGPQGPKGQKGDSGIHGSNGHQGPRGIPGMKGEVGGQGMKGERGDSANITIPVYATLNDLTESMGAGSLVYVEEDRSVAIFNGKRWDVVNGLGTVVSKDRHCGDGEASGEEECDRDDFAEMTCADFYGPDAEGELACSRNCVIDASHCSVRKGQAKVYMAALNKRYTGNIGGIVRADQMCNNEARKAGRNETYRAFLGSSVQKLHLVLPWPNYGSPIVNIKGELLFDSWDNLLDEDNGKMFTDSKMYTFSGHPISRKHPFIWHGSLAEGSVAQNKNCHDWFSESDFGLCSNLEKFRVLQQELHRCKQKRYVLCISVNSEQTEEELLP